MSPPTSNSRYAIYWAPEHGHALWRAGCEWLGRDPEDARCVHEARGHTAEPRRYGFHATLKAPLRLRESVSPDQLEGALAALAAGMPRFPMPPLEVTTLSGFVTLRPTFVVDAHHPLRRLADACVRELDAFRAPMDDAELARRSAGLADTQRELLARWGYPQVFDHWRFHMTLSDSLPADAQAERDAIVEDARRHFLAALSLPLACESVSLFVEPAPGEPFVLARRFPLSA